MPVLDWLGKSAVTNHHNQVPYRLVHCNGSLSSGDKDSGNLLVQGDNLVALKALLPHYAGQVKCIYIDPPYNTGNEGWVYNDNVNSDTIRKWLGKVVGKDAEDLSRHDKWLCMMYPRLKILKEFLRDDGVIFVSIDDNEQANLKLLMDEIFGENNLLGQFVWTTKNAARGVPPKTMLMSNHEYIITYARNIDKIKFKGIARDTNDFANPDNDPRGLWRSESIKATGLQDSFFDIVNPQTGDIFHANWAFSEITIKRMIAEDLILFPKNKKGTPRQKKFFNSYLNDRKAFVTYLGWFSTETGTKQFEEILGQDAFIFTKPIDLIKFLVEQATDTENDCIILDSFAGSGTTGHAVLQANAEDGGNRRFILVEMDKAIAQEVTAQRLTKVIGGYFKNGDSDKPVAGLGGGFRFCRLGKPLFDEWGDL